MTDPNDGVPPADVISHAEVIRRGREVLDAGRLRQATMMGDCIFTGCEDCASARIAALLRAIADAGQWRTDLTTGDRWGVPWDVWRAAHALAAPLLGDDRWPS